VFLWHWRRLRSVLEERSDLYAKPLRYLEKAAGADPIRPGLVFLNLLIGNLESPRKLFLSHAKKISPLANLPADMIIDAFSQICHAAHPLGEPENRIAPQNDRKDQIHTSPNADKVNEKFTVFGLRRGGDSRHLSGIRSWIAEGDTPERVKLL